MTNKWKTTKLSNVAYITSGQGAPKLASDFDEEGIPFIRAGNLDHLVKGGSERDCEHITTETARKYGLKLFTPGTVLFAKSGMSAKLDRVYQLKFDAYVVNHLAAIIPSNDCDSSFLKYWFQSNPPSGLIKDASYPSIRLSDIAEIQLPLPPIHEQRRIAAILDKSDAICRRQQESIALCHDLIPSLYKEIFGDLSEYKSRRLSELCEFITKGTTPNSSELREIPLRGDIPFLKVLHITDFGEINFNSKPSYISNKLHNGTFKRSKVYPGDVLMNIVGPPLGKIGYVNDEFPEWNVNQAIAIFRVKKDIYPMYLLYTLRQHKILTHIISLAAGIRQQNISLEQCRNIEIPVPSESLQSSFCNKLKNIHKFKKERLNSIKLSTTLFESCIQSTFRGN